MTDKELDFKNPSLREDWVKIGKSSRSVDVMSEVEIRRIVPMIFATRLHATSK